MPSSNDPVGQPPLTRPSASPPGQTAPARPAAPTMVRCPACASQVVAGTPVCPVCGEDLEEKPRRIRCRRCGRMASSQLTICPHCGRELTPAASRWLTWGVPILAVAVLIGLVTVQSDSGNPLRWVGARVNAATEWVSNLSAGLDPQLEVIAVARPATSGVSGAQAPASGAIASGAIASGEGSDVLPQFGFTGTAPMAAGGDVGEEASTTAEGESQPLDAATIVTGTDGAAGSSAEGESESPGAAPGDTPGDIPGDIPGDEPSEPATPTPAPTQAPTQIPTQAPTQSSSQTPTAAAVPLLPTSTQPPPTPVATATPVPPTPAPTNTPAEQQYIVQQGDTSLSIALRFDVTLDQLMLANDLTPAEATLIQPGQVLRIPAPGTSGGAPAGTIYTVRAGDTLLDISRRVGVPVAAILAANDMAESDATRIRPDDRLVIPAPTPTPGPTATPTPIATATPLPPPTATPAPQATATATPAPSLALRLPAPRLRGPQDGVTIRCSSDGRLSWEAVAGIASSDRYRVHLGFVSARDAAGNPSVTWLIDQNLAPTTTQAALDKSLCDMAPEAMGRQWRWYVEVMDAQGSAPVPASPPSAVWGFVWN